MHVPPIHRAPLALALAALASSAVIVPAAAAEPTTVSWTAPVDVRVAAGIELQDADFSARNVAVTWQQPAAGSPTVGLRTSVESGDAFGPVETFTGARQPAVDVCGGSEVDLAYAKRVGGGDWVIRHSVGSVDATGFLTRTVAPGSGTSRHPDVACAGGRVFVSWFEREVGGDRLNVAHANRGGGAFGAPISLGVDDETFFGRSLALAGTSHTAYAAFTRSDGQLRMKRWSIGGAPSFAVTGHAAQVVAPGTADDSADGAVIAAAGDTVAVAWFRCDALYARVSNDRGQTWGPVRTLIEHEACFGDFGTSQRSIAIRGDRIVVTYLAHGIESPGWVGLIETTDDFATLSDETIAPVAHHEHLVGFVTVDGVGKLAAAYDPGDRIRARREP